MALATDPSTTPEVAREPVSRSVFIYPTTVPTSTVSPSFTRISSSSPAAGDGISASTLSVEISMIGSSRSTRSPTFFSQTDTVPSAIDSPICGIGTSTRAISRPFCVCVSGSVGRQVAHGGYDIFDLREKEVLQRRRIWHRSVQRRDPQDGSVQPLERLLVDPHGDLAGQSPGPGILVHDQHAIGL